MHTYHWWILCVLLSLVVNPTRVTVAATPVPVAQPTSVVFIPMVLTACFRPTVTLTVTTDVTEIMVGRSMTVTAVLANTGCVSIGKPSYDVSAVPSTSVTVQGDGVQTHNRSVRPGERDTVTFVIQAQEPGAVTLQVGASFEFFAVDFLPGQDGVIGSAPPITIMAAPTHATEGTASSSYLSAGNHEHGTGTTHIRIAYRDADVGCGNDSCIFGPFYILRRKEHISGAEFYERASFGAVTQ